MPAKGGTCDGMLPSESRGLPVTPARAALVSGSEDSTGSFLFQCTVVPCVGIRAACEISRLGRAANERSTSRQQHTFDRPRLDDLQLAVMPHKAILGTTGLNWSWVDC